MFYSPWRLSILFACSVSLLACTPPPKKSDKVPNVLDLVTEHFQENSSQQDLLDSLNDNTEALAPTIPPQDIENSGSLPRFNSVEDKSPKLKADADIALSYEQANIRLVIEELSDYMGLTTVIDPNVKGKVTMRTPPDKKLTERDVWPLLQLFLYSNNINMEKRGNVYHFKKMNKAGLPSSFSHRHGKTQKDATEVFQVTPLRYINLEAGVAALKPMVEPQGRLISLPTLNVIGITASPDHLARINHLLSLIDADPFVHRGIRLFRLHNVKAQNVKKDLENILKAVEGKNPSYKLIALERLNAILVVAPPQRGFTEVKRWISILDEENEAGGEQVFIYKVRNLKAGNLATTLNEVFKQEKDKDEPEKKKKITQKSPIQKTGNKTKTSTKTDTSASSVGQKGISAALEVTIVSDEDTNSLLVRATPKDYRQLLQTIVLLDTVPKEVMINVIVAEVELTENFQFGIDWNVLLGDRSFIGVDFSVPGAASRSATSITRSDGNNGLIIGQVGSRITSVLNALNSNGHVELLSRPSILVRDNQEASINVGTDEPTITRVNQTQTSLTTATNTGLTTSNEVTYRKAGVILKVKPQINQDGFVNMEISQEVSQLGAERNNLPSFSERIIETSLVVRDQQAIVIGGLIQTRSNYNKEGLPWLSDVPVVGSAFSSRDDQVVRTELVLFIIPQIIRPEADNSQYVQKYQQRMQMINELFRREFELEQAKLEAANDDNEAEAQ